MKRLIISIAAILAAVTAMAQPPVGGGRPGGRPQGQGYGRPQGQGYNRPQGGGAPREGGAG